MYFNQKVAPSIKYTRIISVYYFISAFRNFHFDVDTSFTIIGTISLFLIRFQSKDNNYFANFTLTSPCFTN